MKRTGKALAGFLLTMALALGLMAGMSLTAYADGQKAYAAYDVTTNTNKNKAGKDLTALQVTFNGFKWYIYRRQFLRRQNRNGNAARGGYELWFVCV